ncbi:hypothetical protein IWQ57_002927, partial [Coemansia nantahalensis]
PPAQGSVHGCVVAAAGQPAAHQQLLAAAQRAAEPAVAGDGCWIQRYIRAVARRRGVGQLLERPPPPSPLWPPAAAQHLNRPRRAAPHPVRPVHRHRAGPGRPGCRRL